MPWYTRPIVFTRDAVTSAAFYESKLGFGRDWTHEEEGVPIVLQVSRGDCELILALDDKRAGSGRLFVSLETDELAQLKEEIAARQVESERVQWGYPCLLIKDPDGNELMVALEE